MSKTCPDCKMEIPDYARVCPHCGYRFSNQQLNQEVREGRSGAATFIIGLGGLCLFSAISSWGTGDDETIMTIVIIIGIVLVIWGLIKLIKARR